MTHTVEITSREQVEEIMKPGGPSALIDFWASWCGPCRMMAPNYEAAAEVMADEPVTFYKVDTQKYPEISAAFNVRSLPTVVAVSDGKVEDVVVGAQDCLSLKRIAERLVSRSEGDGFFSRLFRAS